MALLTRLAALAWVGALGAGCSSADAVAASDEDLTGAANADVNDVAVLWPLPADNGNESTLLRFEAHGKDGAPLLTGPQFGDLTGMMKKVGAVFVRDFDNSSRWRVVGVRVDPCSPTDHAGTTLTGAACHVEVRLIAQPLDPAAKRGFGDAGIHLVYELRQADAKPLIQSILALRDTKNAPTAGKPLGPHPTIVHEGPGGAFSIGLMNLIKRTVSSSNLRDATVVAATDVEANVRRFLMTSRNATTGRLEIRSIPGVKNSQDMGPFSNMWITNGVEAFPSGVTVAPNMNDIFPHVLGDVSDADATNMLAIDNPFLRTRGSGDCVSCHSASRVLASKRGVAFLAPNHDQDAHRFPRVPGGSPPISLGGITMTNTAATTDPFPNSINVHSFSYLGTTASYTQGTLNDVARVVAIVNQQLFVK